MLASDAVATGGASLSPDATKVAYTNAAGIKIACVPSSACTAAILANTTIGDAQPAWSPPDGAHSGQIAFIRGGNLWLTAADGSGTATQLTSGAVVADPAWSPDGTKIAFARQSGTSDYEIWVLTIGGTQKQLTTAAGVQDRHPTWNPSSTGSTVAFSSNRSGTNEIYTVSSNGGTLTQVTNDATADTSPVWLPDGSAIGFTQGTSIKTIPPSGGSETTVDSSGLTTPATADWQTLVPTPGATAPSVTANSALSQGDTVTASAGSWNQAQRFSYQFLRCDSVGAGCVPVGSASSSSSYTLTSADVGSTIRVQVAGIDTAGTGSFVLSSNYSPVVDGPGPENLDEPSISLPFSATSSAPAVGNFLTGDAGDWSGSGNTYVYQWVKCAGESGSCYTIAGATTLSLTVTSDLYGWNLRLKVTATNDLGSRTAYSAATEPVTATAPSNKVSPQISGLNQVGAMLSVGTGTWLGTSPITFTYEWRRCNPQGDLTSCVAIKGATDPTYVLTAADTGVAIRAYVTAHNVAGAVAAFTNHTLPTLPANAVTPPAQPSPVPANATPPTIAGTAAVGTVLQANRGTWTGRGPLKYHYAWQRCDAIGAGCKAIRGALKAIYAVRTVDLGSTLRVVVTATNSSGHAVAHSAVTEAVSLARPLPRGRHIVGSARSDYLAGGGGNDRILGLGGNDTILGGAGNDALYGGSGNDVIDGGPGKDHILGGPGNDTIRAADGVRDVIDCGPGRDHVIVDSVDKIANCELVTIATPAATTASP